MADRPILFSGPMVRALLDGTKSQTRRALSTKPNTLRPNLFDGTWTDDYVLDQGNKSWRDQACRFAVGDRLWVRETWTARMTHGWTIADARSRMYQEEIIYQADGDKSIDGWWPSIHLPREFSRLTLTVTDVRVERLQDISEEDAWAEGIEAVMKRGIPTRHDVTLDLPGSPRWFQPRGIDVYQSVWEAINGPGSWEANPWVAAYTFTVERGNIDQLARAA